MLKSLFTYAKELDLEDVGELTLQDVVLCRLWLDGAGGGGKGSGELAERLESWTGGTSEAGPATAGRRYQLLLRELIGVMQTEDRSRLRRDEAEFVCLAYRLAREYPDCPHAKRVIDLLEPHVELLENRKDRLDPVPELKSLARRLYVATGEDLAAAPTETVRFLAGIELPCRGPVFKCKQNLQVIGDVPDTSTVMVAKGACAVKGYLLGRVLTKQSCDVLGNIAGVVIALHGDVRARSIVNNAHVVTKMGSVVCHTAQGPKLVFAGNRVDIGHSAMLGSYIAKDMNIEGDVRGGVIHVSREVRADRFRHSGGNTLALVLRKELSCDDYGEMTGPELKRLLSEAYRLRQTAENLTTMANLNRAKAEHTATSVLMYVFGGGEEYQKKLHEVVTLQRRMDVLDRLIASVRSLMALGQDQIGGDDREGQTGGEGGEAFLTGEDNSIVVKEFSEENALMQEYRERLQKRRAGEIAQTREMHNQMHDKLAGMIAERGRLQEHIAAVEQEIQSSCQYGDLLRTTKEDDTKLKVFKQVLPALKNYPPDSPIGKRMQATFVRLAQRTIDVATRHADEFEEKAQKYTDDFQTVSRRLGDEFQVQVPLLRETSEVNASAVGQFDEGIEIYGSLDAYDADIPVKGSFIVTPSPEGEIRRYVRPSEGEGFHSEVVGDRER